MSDEEIVNLAKAYVMMLHEAANEPYATEGRDDEMRKYMQTDEHRTGLVIGFVRGYRACEAMRSTPTLQPGSN